MSSRNLISTSSESADAVHGLTGPRTEFMASIHGAFTVMLGKLDDALFEWAQAARGDLERGNYFDAIREVRLGREAINGRFMDRLLACWQGLERGEGPAERQLGGQDLDEAIALTAAVRRAETQCADALRLVRVALALAVGVPDGDDILGPRQVFAAFEAAFRDTPADPAMRLVVLMFFERHVGVVLPGIYRQLTAALELPTVAANRGLPAQLGDVPALDALMSESNQGGGDLDLSALIQRALAGSGDIGQGSEATKLLATLQQHDRPGSRSRSASIDVARFATRPAENAPADPSQQMVLDMVALLFDGVFTDSAVPVSARLNIARLQIPFLRLALRDRTVLARRSHLGRRFFDQLIAVTRGWQEPPTPQQKEVLEALVDSVGEACMDDHRAFSAAAETGLMDLRTLALPTADPALAVQAHRRTLTARAEKELAERRHQVGRLPDPVDAFLRTHWVQYLADCLERHGADASPWRQALATLDALLWSLGPKDGPAQQRLAELRPRMTRRLRQGMDQIGVSMFEQEALLETLDAILDRAQAGQPVWDWDQESAIDELLGVGESVSLPASAVSVIELDKLASPVRLVVKRQPAPVAEVEAVFEEEEVVSLDELEAELSLEQIEPLELPSVEVVVELAQPLEQVQIESVAIQIDAADADEALLETDVSADLQAELDKVEGELSEQTADEWVKQAELVEATDDEPVVPDQAAGDLNADQAVSAREPAADVSSLEALMRRRGLTAAAHVEEVEVTERGVRT